VYTVTGGIAGGVVGFTALLVTVLLAPRFLKIFKENYRVSYGA
jgi:hypothetical protein